MNFGGKVDISSNLANVRWVRFGWLVWLNTGGSAPLHGRCGGDVDLWSPN